MYENHIKVINCVKDNSNYNLNNINAFNKKADTYLIANAMDHSFTVVTEESRLKGLVRIPAVCNAMDVKHLNTFEMLRKENINFSFVKISIRMNFHNNYIY